MLEVRFSEIKRGALKDLGFSMASSRAAADNGFQGVFGGGAGLNGSIGSTPPRTPTR
jgi:Flp pilus assembly secretin CpaC